MTRLPYLGSWILFLFANTAIVFTEDISDEKDYSVEFCKAAYEKNPYKTITSCKQEKVIKGNIRKSDRLRSYYADEPKKVLCMLDDDNVFFMLEKQTNARSKYVRNHVVDSGKSYGNTSTIVFNDKLLLNIYPGRFVFNFLNTNADIPNSTLAYTFKMPRIFRDINPKNLSGKSEDVLIFTQSQGITVFFKHRINFTYSEATNGHLNIPPEVYYFFRDNGKMYLRKLSDNDNVHDVHREKAFLFDRLYHGYQDGEHLVMFDDENTYVHTIAFYGLTQVYKDEKNTGPELKHSQEEYNKYFQCSQEQFWEARCPKCEKKDPEEPSTNTPIMIFILIVFAVIVFICFFCATIKFFQIRQKQEEVNKTKSELNNILREINEKARKSQHYGPTLGQLEKNIGVDYHKQEDPEPSLKSHFYKIPGKEKTKGNRGKKSRRETSGKKPKEQGSRKSRRKSHGKRKQSKPAFPETGLDSQPTSGPSKSQIAAESAESRNTTSAEKNLKSHPPKLVKKSLKKSGRKSLKNDSVFTSKVNSDDKIISLIRSKSTAFDGGAPVVVKSKKPKTAKKKTKSISKKPIKKSVRQTRTKSKKQSPKKSLKKSKKSLEKSKAAKARKATLEKSEKSSNGRLSAAESKESNPLRMNSRIFAEIKKKSKPSDKDKKA